MYGKHNPTKLNIGWTIRDTNATLQIRFLENPANHNTLYH